VVFDSLDILSHRGGFYRRYMDRRERPIEIPAHASAQMRTRGATADEVADAIRTATWRPARGGRLHCRKTFPYHAAWRGRYYRAKRVRVFFIEEAERIIVVTVLTYYF